MIPIFASGVLLEYFSLIKKLHFRLNWYVFSHMYFYTVEFYTGAVVLRMNGANRPRTMIKEGK